MTDDELTAANAEVFKHFDRRETASERVLCLRQWALALFCWDGLLPIAVIAIPKLVKFFLPNWQFGLGLCFMLLPVTALSVRVVIGWARMQRGLSYPWQMVVFIIAVSALFLFEMFILNDLVAGGPKIAAQTILLKLFIVYFATMAIALFPFRALITGKNMPLN